MEISRFLDFSCVVMITAPPPSVTKQQSDRCKGLEIGFEDNASSMLKVELFALWLLWLNENLFDDLKYCKSLNNPIIW